MSERREGSNCSKIVLDSFVIYNLFFFLFNYLFVHSFVYLIAFAYLVTLEGTSRW